MRAYGPTVLRVFLGVFFIVHGVEKLFGVWGGGLTDTVAALARLHVPAAYPAAVGIAAGELACGILLLLGVFHVFNMRDARPRPYRQLACAPARHA